MAAQTISQTGPKQRNECREAQSQPDVALPPQPVAAGNQYFDQHDVQRDNGHDQGGEAAGQILLTPYQGEVAAEQQHQAEEHEPRHHSTIPEDTPAAQRAEGEHHGRADQHAGAGEDGGGQQLHAHAHGGVGGSPAKVHAQESEDDRELGWPGPSAVGRYGRGHDGDSSIVSCARRCQDSCWFAREQEWLIL